MIETRFYREKLTNDTGGPAEDTETNVDEEVDATARLEEYGEGGEEDRDEVGEDVGLGM